jgi:outer membrane beta-barrel protein
VRLGTYSLLAIVFSSSLLAAVNPKLAPDPAWVDEIPPIYKEVSIVQNKAMQKAHRFLLSPYISLDFSDSPYNQYGTAIDVGYALSDFWEIYVHTVPYYITNLRSYVRQIQDNGLQFPDGSLPQIVTAEPKRELGGSILWAFAYGKDSVGTKNLIRSDTFLRFSASSIQYSSTSGLNFGLGFGKTFFINRYWGLRATLQGSYLQTPNFVGTKDYRSALSIELGTIVYL